MIGLFYLLNGISTPQGLFYTKLWLIPKCLVVIITKFLMFHGIYLNSSFSVVDNHFWFSWLIDFNDMSTRLGLSLV